MVGCPHLWSLRWLQWFAPTSVACARGALLPESPLAHRERSSCISPAPRLTLPNMVPCFYGSPRPPPKGVLAVAHYSLACLGCLHTANRSLLLGLTSKAIVSAPSPRLSVSGRGVLGSCAFISLSLSLSLSLICPPQTSFCAFSQGFQVPPLSHLISLPVRGLPLFHGSFLGVQLLPSFLFLTSPLSFSFLSVLPGYMEVFLPFLEV